MVPHTRSRARARRRGIAAASLAATSTAAVASLAAAPAASAQATPAPTTPPPPAPTFHVSHDVLVGHDAWVTGRDGSGTAGRALAIQVRAGGHWTTVARVRTHAGGRFRAAWRADRLGRYSVRVGTPGSGGAVSAAAAGHAVTVYRAVEASWYAPGGSLACGGSYDPGTLGVANKTLPCGTEVTLRYGSRSVTVPVIDRGPYVAGREYDLTQATKDQLGFPDTGTVWASR